ncbi:MAG: hypothetical protein SFX73_12690 [Kofleriaceae bacterium]|nr:hypothetical protein [Kofleriaceae bacterium]
MRVAWVAVLSLVSSACLDEKGPEEELPEDGKDDSFYRPTDHGALELGVPVTSAITDAEKFHAWTFELDGDASIDLVTSYAVRGQRRTDTVLYLYKEGPNGWGSYIARNDDYGSTTYSRIQRTLTAGRYRALVKGHLASTRGRFALTASCDGAGCAGGCLFGETYNDVATAPGVQTLNANQITAATLGWLSGEAQQMLVRAVQQSSHTDVTTPEEALSRVDQGVVNVTWLYEDAAQRSFLAFEYGAGDNSYGAIFEKESEAMVSSIHDGDLLQCTVQREHCLFPDTYQGLKYTTAFTRLAHREVTAASQLSASENAQAEIMFRHVYEQTLTAAEGIAMADRQMINVERYRHNATQREVTVFELGAGDTSVGAIFHSNTTELAGVISDLQIDGCTLFAPRPS